MNDIQSELDDLLDITKAAQRLGISRARVYQLIEDGTIPVIIVGGRKFIHPADLGPARNRNTQRGNPNLQS